MKHDVKAPAVGESITEVRIAGWKKRSGEAVKPGEVLIEIESDKATVEVAADSPGVLTIQRPAGEMVKIGEVLGFIDDAASATVAGAASAAAKGNGAPVSPAVRKMTSEQGIDPASIRGTGKGGRVTKGDVIDRAESGAKSAAQATTAPASSVSSAPSPAAPPLSRAGGATYAGDPRDKRVPMTLLRQRIAERLVQAQRTAAILTTFNECDMGAVMELRAKHKETFKAKHGVGLGFMSFFTRAVVEALKAVPTVNAMIDGKDAIYRDYFDIGVAVGTERGLVVPVLRDAGAMGFPEIEKGILALAEKAKTGKLSMQDLSGGTFTISNGGTYGSLLSTPILNPPQSGILGMHKIQDRPMAVNGAVLVRPMMYLALSYDHRMIDGKEAVTFLVKVKEGIEDPAKLGFTV